MAGENRILCYRGFPEDIEPSKHRKIAFFSVSEGNERVENTLIGLVFFIKTSYFTVFDYVQQFPIVFGMIWKNFKKSIFWNFSNHFKNDWRLLDIVKSSEIWNFLRKNKSDKGVFRLFGPLISFRNTKKPLFFVLRALYPRGSHMGR